MIINCSQQPQFQIDTNQNQQRPTISSPPIDLINNPTIDFNNNQIADLNNTNNPTININKNQPNHQKQIQFENNSQQKQPKGQQNEQQQQEQQQPQVVQQQQQKQPHHQFVANANNSVSAKGVNLVISDQQVDEKMIK